MSNLFFVKSYKSPDVVVPGNGYNDVYISVPDIAGYDRTVWYEYITNSPNGGVNESLCNIYRTTITPEEDNMRSRIRNNANSDAKVQVTIRMLYMRSDCSGQSL